LISQYLFGSITCTFLHVARFFKSSDRHYSRNTKKQLICWKAILTIPAGCSKRSFNRNCEMRDFEGTKDLKSMAHRLFPVPMFQTEAAKNY